MISSPFPHHTIASLRQVGMMGLTPLLWKPLSWKYPWEVLHLFRCSTHTQTHAFTHRLVYKQTLLHKAQAPFTHKHTHIHTHTRFYRDAFTRRPFDTQMLLHTDACTHSLHKHPFTHTHAFTHRCFYTQMLLHTATFANRRFYMLLPQFLTVGFVRKGCRRGLQFYLRFWRSTSFRAKGLPPKFQTRNFASISDSRTSFRAKWLRRTLENHSY